MRRRAFSLALIIGLVAWGCDSGPSGPGNLVGTVQSVDRPVGGAVLEVVGKGIQGFSGAGGSRVFWAPKGTTDTYRVVVITPTAGDPQFQVAVADLGAGKPRATVISVVDGSNLTLPPTSDYKVRFKR